MPINNSDKNRLEEELEKLSWEFMMEINKPAAQSEDELEFLEEETDPSRAKTPESGEAEEEKIELEQSGNNQEVESWYEGGDYGVNDMGRSSGIVFDEDKLKQARITEWHGAEKLRTSWVEKLARGIGMIVIWPFKAVYLIGTYFFQGLFGAIGFLSNLVYKAIRGIVLFPWQLAMALKYTFVYLFGDFFWAGKEAVPVQVRAGGAVWRRVAVFIMIAIILVLPVFSYITYNKVQGVKGRVLGASELGLTHLYQAGTASKGFDFESAGKEFNLAEAEFTVAQERDRKSTRLNSSHTDISRMPSSA